MSVDILPYEPRHLDEILDLSVRAWTPVFVSIEATLPPAVFAAFYPEGWRVRHRQETRTACEEDPSSMWVAVSDSAVVGFVATRLHESDRMGEIHVIGVDPDHQGQGVGSQLIAFALDRLREAGMPLAMVETGADPGHAPARRAYERAGFGLWPVARYFRALDGGG